MNTSRKCLSAIISFPLQNSVFKHLLHTGGCGGHMMGSSDSSSKDKWEHTETEIVSIVKHMQTLALLCPSSSPSGIAGENNEQVKYLKSAMKIASLLTLVNTEDASPMYNPSQMISAYLREDIPATLNDNQQDIVLSNSKQSKYGLFVTPPIPTSKTS